MRPHVDARGQCFHCSAREEAVVGIVLDRRFGSPESGHMPCGRYASLHCYSGCRRSLLLHLVRQAQARPPRRRPHISVGFAAPCSQSHPRRQIDPQKVQPQPPRRRLGATILSRCVREAKCPSQWLRLPRPSASLRLGRWGLRRPDRVAAPRNPIATTNTLALPHRRKASAATGIRGRADIRCMPRENM